MATKSRIEKLEKKLKPNQRVWDAASLFNPSEGEIERAHREYPGATLFIIDIRPPSKEDGGIEE